MKGDFTRDTFHPENHYQQVLMQQGRVQLDADWNEQSAIGVRRDETTSRDLFGPCGGPADNAAFRIITDEVVLFELPADPLAPIRQFALSAGRYYVQGRQCEAEAPFLFSWQPDHRESAALTAGTFLVYLDVWQRHLTMHEDTGIRESALGGPDTSTRLKTIWQVRVAPLDTPSDPDNPTDDPCHQLSSEFDQRQRAALPRLAARMASANPESEPCTVPTSAGYRGLENQLYRVEIHTPGDMATATFKWSRENASVVTRITDSVNVLVDGVNVTRLTVVSTGQDEHLGFRPGNIVEIIHDSEELEGNPGTLAMVGDGNGDVDDATGRIMLKSFAAEPMPVTINLESNPRLRRWEQFGHVAADPAVNSGFVALENGLEIQFDLSAGGEFRTGDYWLIPARTASADAQSGRIEWPSGSSPVFLPPKGITHHYCRLGVVSVNETGVVTLISDCRCLWPPLTAVPRLFYVSGDGQEVMPDLNEAAGTLVRLPHPLIVGVANGHCLEQATRVRFDVVNTATSPSEGQVAVPDGVPSGTSAVVLLDATGLASADFYPDHTNSTQQVIARLLDSAGNPVSLPVIFNASLSIASQVAFQPGECAGLAGQVTVQDAIDHLAGQLSLYKVSGDAQTGSAGNPLPQAITVLVANRCGPMSGVPVMFTPRVGDGSIDGDLPVITGSDGFAACKWIPGSSPVTQELEASIADNVSFTTAPSSVRFTAQISSGDAASPGMRIKGIFSRPRPLRLGMRMAVNEMASGLDIDCDQDVDPSTVLDALVNRGEPTCFVTVEVPILPLTRDQVALWGSDGLVGYTPVVLAADVQVNGNRISWLPSRFAVIGLNNVLNQMRQFGGRFGEQILARLKLKGNFIWADRGNRREQRVYLDGETFRLPERDDEFGVQLPSGDGRRGGDFEMWFWLTPG